MKLLKSIKNNVCHNFTTFNYNYTIINSSIIRFINISLIAFWFINKTKIIILKSKYCLIWCHLIKIRLFDIIMNKALICSHLELSSKSIKLGMLKCKFFVIINWNLNNRYYRYLHIIIVRYH